MRNTVAEMPVNSLFILVERFDVLNIIAELV